MNIERNLEMLRCFYFRLKKHNFRFQCKNYTIFFHFVQALRKLWFIWKHRKTTLIVKFFFKVLSLFFQHDSTAFPMKKSEKLNFKHDKITSNKPIPSFVTAVHFLSENVIFMRQNNNFEIYQLNSELEKVNFRKLISNHKKCWEIDKIKI